MRPEGRAFVQRIIVEFAIPEPIYEFGSFRVEGQEELANLRPLFPGKTYVGCDQAEGPGVDKIQNIEHITLPDNHVGTIICIDTLEHVQNVYKAMGEMHRILKPGGLIMVASVMYFPIHNYPDDYWRFTPSAFSLLLKNFSWKRVTSDGDPRFPRGIYGVGIK